MQKSAWIDKDQYPFKSNYLPLKMGKMHYLDEGEGEIILLVHGNPYWSFMYREQIKILSKNYRCIAIDHIGFGLSDKPYNWSYLPKEHSENLTALINHLNLKGIHLVVHDWGGPIGLSYAVDHAENIKKLVITNTWMWSLEGDPTTERFSKLFGGFVGRNLIRYANLMLLMLPQTFADKDKFKAVKKHFYGQFKKPADRKGNWTFPKQVIASNNWLNSLWEKRANIETIKTLLVWGLNDPIFRKREFEKWNKTLKNVTAIKQRNTGHYVAEEMGAKLGHLIEDFINNNELIFKSFK